MSGDGLSFQNYLSVRSAYSPTFDASGSRVAFLTDITGIPQVWSVELTGGWPHQLTFFDERVTSVEWAPVVLAEHRRCWNHCSSDRFA